MSELSDERLMAYADGELAPAEREQVKAYLLQNPKAEERVQMFVRTRTGLRQLFDWPSREPVPARLLETIVGSQARPPAVRRSAKFELAGWISSALEWILPGWRPMRTAVAFSSALAIGAGAGWYWHATPFQGDASEPLAEMLDGRVVAQGDLSRALDTASSGTPIKLGGGSTPAVLRTVLTFQTQDGTYCRQYEMDMSDAQRFSGLGCRDSFGRWRLEVHTINSVASRPTGVAPATGATSPLVDAAVDRSIKGDVLGREEEAALIKKNWRTTRP